MSDDGNLCRQADNHYFLCEHVKFRMIDSPGLSVDAMRSGSSAWYWAPMEIFCIQT